MVYALQNTYPIHRRFAMQTILLADNQAIFRAGMQRVLSRDAGLQVIRQCEDPESLKEALKQVSGAVVIFPSSFARDLSLVLDWIDRASSRAIMILEHGATAEASVLDRTDGIVPRSVAGDQLIECIHRVARGERRVREAAAVPLEELDLVGIKVLERLTPKELEIVALVTDGAKNREIAERLRTKEQVVKNYLRSIYDKTGVSDRLELALYTVHHPALARATQPMRERR